MGNSASLEIRLHPSAPPRGKELPKYRAGDMLEGSMYLHAPSSFAAYQLKLELIGVEETSVLDSRKTKREGVHSILTMSFPLASFADATGAANGMAPEGQHEYPFSLQLPDDIPTSLVAKNRKGRCCIRYVVTGRVTKLKRDGSEVGIMSAEAGFNVRMKAKTLPTNPKVYPSALPPVPGPQPCCAWTGLCGRSRGGAVLVTAMASSGGVAHPSNVLLFRFRVKNYSHRNCVKADVSFIERTSWIAVNPKTHDKEVAQVTRVFASSTVANSQFFRRAATLAARRTPSQLMTNSEWDQEELELLRADSSGCVNINVKIPASAQHTYAKGNLIHVQHVLQLRVHFAGSQPAHVMEVPVKIRPTVDGAVLGPAEMPSQPIQATVVGNASESAGTESITLYAIAVDSADGEVGEGHGGVDSDAPVASVVQDARPVRPNDDELALSWHGTRSPVVQIPVNAVVRNYSHPQA